MKDTRELLSLVRDLVDDINEDQVQNVVIGASIGIEEDLRTAEGGFKTFLPDGSWELEIKIKLQK